VRQAIISFVLAAIAAPGVLAQFPCMSGPNVVADTNPASSACAGWRAGPYTETREYLASCTQSACDLVAYVSANGACSSIAYLVNCEPDWQVGWTGGGGLSYFYVRTSNAVQITTVGVPLPWCSYQSWIETDSATCVCCTS